MIIRRAKVDDIPSILELLSQVLEIHAKLRPDIFASGTTKYSFGELKDIIKDDNRPIYVVDEDNNILAYAFCEIKSPKCSSTMRPIKIFYIDDFCVDAKYRKQHIGKTLFEYILNEAKRLGCYEITLAHWDGNESAKEFYEKMGFKVKYSMMELIIE